MVRPATRPGRRGVVEPGFTRTVGQCSRRRRAPLPDDTDDPGPAGCRGGEPVDPAVLRRPAGGSADPARGRMRTTGRVPGDRVGPAARAGDRTRLSYNGFSQHSPA